MTAEKTVEINGNTYSVGKLDAFKQFHVARRLAPLLVGIGASLKDGQDFDFRSEFAASFARSLASMEDKEVDYIFNTCLGVCQRQQKTNNTEIWVPVQSKQVRSLMFEDMDMATIVQLSFEVIGENLENFFTMTQQSSQIGA